MNPPIPEPDPKHPGMFPEAIDRRLRHLGQIYLLAKSLRDAHWLGPINTPLETDGGPVGDTTSEKIKSSSSFELIDSDSI